VNRPAAERSARAVVTTLCERLSGGQAADLVEQLRPPDDFVPGVSTLRSRQAEPFGLDEFLRRVAQRDHLGEDIARSRAIAVLHALRLVVPSPEIQDSVDQLPAEFDPLLESWGRRRLVLTSGRDLALLVADRNGLAVEEAGRVGEGVLAVLAERLPDREVDELEQQLPTDLQAALERGRARRSAPRRLTVDAFLDLLGDRVGTDHEQAREYARAVLPPLVAAVDDRMLADLLIQLPDDIAELV
jgi:uncharacterized protein (DUF2267 family)